MGTIDRSDIDALTRAAGGGVNGTSSDTILPIPTYVTPVIKWCYVILRLLYHILPMYL